MWVCVEVYVFVSVYVNSVYIGHYSVEYFHLWLCWENPLTV